MPERSILLNPGPGTTTETVKQAQVVSDICPRESAFGEVIQKLRKDLVALADAGESHEAVLLPGPGSFAIESVLHAVKAGGEPLLIFSNGSYGERAIAIVERLGMWHRVVRLPWNRPLTVEDVDQAYREHGDAIAFCYWVHHETSTGLLNPLEPLALRCRALGWRSGVDGMSSFGSVPLEEPAGGADVLISSSNKCLQGLPGVGVILGERTWLESLESGQPGTLALDLGRHYRVERDTGEFPFTPPVQVLYALHQAVIELKAETVVGRHLRYRANARQLLEGMASMGFIPLLDEAHQSYILLAFLAHEHPQWTFEGMHDQLLAHGITLYPGKSEYETETFRMAVIGDLHGEDMDRVLNTVKHFMQSLGPAGP